MRGMGRDEFRQRINRAKPIEDDSTTMVEDSGGGQVIRATRVQGGEGESVFNIEPYWFIVSILTPEWVLVTDGYFVHGSTVEYKAQQSVAISGLSTGYLNLLAYYRLFNDTWTFSYESSTGFPVQTPHSRDGNDNPAERFPLAYIDFATGKIDQINVKEIRTLRAG